MTLLKFFTKFKSVILFDGVSNNDGLEVKNKLNDF